MAIEQPAKYPEKRDYDRSAALWSSPELQELPSIKSNGVYFGKIEAMARTYIHVISG